MRPDIRTCDKCYNVCIRKIEQCPRCGDIHKPKESVMKWTKKTEQKMLAIISKHKKLQDGFIDAADELNTSKSAVTNRYYKVMKGKDKLSTFIANAAKPLYELNDQRTRQSLEYSRSIMVDKQKIGWAMRNVDKKPLVIDHAVADYTRNFDKAINPPISCDAGAVNYCYTIKPKIEDQKPKSFIEKVLAFFKGGKDE